MFKRYSDNARRVIFFARFEASKYGSQYIETEHLLLGLAREDPTLCERFMGRTSVAAEIRTEIESKITPHKHASTAVEVPLSDESRQVLKLAAQESNRLRHLQVRPKHILVGILRLEGSLGARLLREKGLTLAPIRNQLAKAPNPRYLRKSAKTALSTLDEFFAGLKSCRPQELLTCFRQNAEFIDASGKRWNREELWKGFDTLFAPYAKQNASYVVEAKLAETCEIFVANVVWQNALLASEPGAWVHRMGVVLVPEADGWQILSVQVTPLQQSQVCAK